MAAKNAPRVVLENSGSGRGRVAQGCSATILVSEPVHLCSAQWATREICRTLGFDEAGVYQAVITVTEFAHKEFIDAGRSGKLHLAAVRSRGKLALEARAE
jgi:hypothetical protein